MIGQDDIFVLWRVFGERVRKDFPRIVLSKVPSKREREYLDEMLQEYDYEDLMIMIDVAVRDWDRVMSTWPTVVRSIIPSFVPMYLLRRDLMAIATARRVPLDNETVQSTGHLPG